MAEGEAGEEVDMETTKGPMKGKTKGTIKKIIKVCYAIEEVHSVSCVSEILILVFIDDISLMINICYCLFSL